MAWSLSPWTSAPALRRVAICARSLRGRRFDVLLHMQLSLRASLALASPCRPPFDSDSTGARARELQWLFTNARIAPRSREHVLDSFLGFLDALGHPRSHAALGRPAAIRSTGLRPEADSRRAPDAGHQPLLESLAAQLASGGVRSGRRSRGAAPWDARDPRRRADCDGASRRGSDRAGGRMCRS